MNPDFELGRRYERSETLDMLGALHGLEDMKRLRAFLLLWENDLQASMHGVITIEETYVVVT
jgi:hypothetical protein